MHCSNNCDIVVPGNREEKMSTLFISNARFEGEGGAFSGSARKDIGDLGDYYVYSGTLSLVEDILKLVKGTLTIKLV